MIFICTFDPFGKKLHRYTFRNECEEIIAKEREEERLAIARKMLQDNVEVNIVAKYTGLSIEEVNEISENM